VWSTGCGSQGGVGWPGYKGVEWSPDSQRVALAYHTNAVGIWEPFGPIAEPWSYAYVTDGGNRPPGFGWGRDGSRVFIDCRLWIEGNEEPGCWIPADRSGDLSSLATPGSPEPAADEAPQAPRPAPQVGADTVRFPDGSAYVDRAPGERHPLYDEDEDLVMRFAVRPVFPVREGEQESWGVCLEEGAVVLPDGVDAERYLAFSLAHRWSWPLRWVPGVARAPSLPELARDPAAPLPGWLRAVFQDQQPPVASGWPPRRGKGHADLVALAVQTLLGLGQGWSSHRDDYLQQVAVTELVRGELGRAREIAGHFSEQGRVVGLSELGLHCALQPGPEHHQQAEDYVVQATSLLPRALEHQRCRVHTFLAGAYHGLGWPAEAGAHLEQAKASYDPEAGRREDAWRLIAVMLLAGRGEGWVEQAARWKLQRSSSVKGALLPLAWYADLDTLLAFKRGCTEHGLMEEHDLLQTFSERVARQSGLERLGECVAAFVSDTYGCHVVTAALEAAGERGDPALAPVLAEWLDKPVEGSRDHWLRWLGVARQRLPALARATLERRTWSLAEVQRWERSLGAQHRVMHALGLVLGHLRLQGLVQAELDTVPPLHRAALLIGLAGPLEPQVCDELLQEAAALLGGEEDRYHLQLWHWLAAASARAGSPRLEAWTRDVVERTLPDDLSMEQLVAALAEAGALAVAYRVWMKIPPGMRRYRLQPLLAAARQARDHDALYDLLISLDAKDLNDRGQQAVRVLNGLTGCGEYRI
jgi:hypothetical protein